MHTVYIAHTWCTVFEYDAVYLSLLHPLLLWVWPN